MKSKRYLVAILWVLVGTMVTGCVYVPAWYYDPVTPPPRYRPADTYAPEGRYYRQHSSNERNRRYYYDEGRRTEQGRTGGEGYGRSDDRYYDPSDELQDRRGLSQGREVIPPSQRDLYAPSPAPVPTPSPSPSQKSSSSSSKDIPVADKTSKPGRVKVPFPPYNELDVSGLTPGSLAKDPSSGKVFRVP